MTNLSYPLSLNQIDQIRPAGLDATVTTHDRTLALLLLEPGAVVTWSKWAYRVTHVAVDRETTTMHVERLTGAAELETVATQFHLHLTAELQV